MAELWLRQKGWTILDRRFRSGHRDIDLIAARPADPVRVVAFIEVKARRSAGFGGPVAAVNWRKQRELCRSAWVWADRFGRVRDTYRFDVIGVLFDAARIRVQHVENAFFAPNRP